MKSVLTAGIVLLLVGLAPFRSSSQDKPGAVMPAKVQPMLNVEPNLSRAGAPAYLPREWGRLVSVQKGIGDAYMMFLENDAGEITVARLSLRGNYFYLDTSPETGIVMQIKRNP
jgi:hypothetical protein